MNTNIIHIQVKTSLTNEKLKKLTTLMPILKTSENVSFAEAPLKRLGLDRKYHYYFYLLANCVPNSFTLVTFSLQSSPSLTTNVLFQSLVLFFSPHLI